MESPATTSTTPASGWPAIAQSLTRPYQVTLPMVLLVSLIPFYPFIGGYVQFRTVYRPAIALDDLFPLQPVWALVYGAVYMFLIVLPVFIVRGREHLRQTVFAYLTIWATAYVFFLAYPTAAPRPSSVDVAGFPAWGLMILYGADPPFNCFPSLHVAHSFVSAATCYVVHRRVGMFALGCAALVGLSTLFTRQHYVLDVVAGAALAGIAWMFFLRRVPRQSVPAIDRHLAPLFAMGVAGLAVAGVLGFWVAYLFTVR